MHALILLMFPALPLADFVLKSPDQLREAYQSACAHIIILDFAAPVVCLQAAVEEKW